MTKRERAAALLQSAGAASGVTAGLLINISLGLSVLAVVLVVFGIAVERRR